MDEAKRVEVFLELIDQNEKTIIFCATQVHARAVRDLINQRKVSNDPNYCTRVTAADGKIGDMHLSHFWLCSRCQDQRAPAEQTTQLDGPEYPSYSER
jgi:hypothetical protein